MSVRLRRRSGGLALLAAGSLFINSANCLPKDFFYVIGGEARDSLIVALTANLVTAVADTLIPPPDNSQTADAQ